MTFCIVIVRIKIEFGVINVAKFCTNCGKELEKDQSFCSNCGTPIENKNVTPPVESTVNVTTNTTVQPAKKNTLALVAFITSLVSSFLCCGVFNVITLILSIVGLLEAKKYDGDGKGFAIAGIVISAIAVFFFFLLLIGGIIGLFDISSSTAYDI